MEVAWRTPRDQTPEGPGSDVVARGMKLALESSAEELSFEVLLS